MPETTILQLGAVAILFAVSIREFFSYLKSRKNGSNGETNFNLIVSELQRMNNNHLHSIHEALEQGNSRLVDTIHNDNVRIIELLGEIKGGLSSRK